MVITHIVCREAPDEKLKIGGQLVYTLVCDFQIVLINITDSVLKLYSSLAGHTDVRGVHGLYLVCWFTKHRAAQ